MATEDDVKLIGIWASPYVSRARIALNLKGMAYEFVQEDFGNKIDGKKSDLLLKSNPVHKKVPVLVHGGKPISESLNIVEYIDEVWPDFGPPILPADAYERAVARFWAAFVDHKIFHMRVLLGDTDEESKMKAKEQVSVALLHLEEAFVKCSKGKSFFGGDTIGFIDIALGSYLGWLKAMETIADVKFLDEEKTPQLVEWAERFYSSAASREVVPEAKELVEYNNVILFARRAAASHSN